MLYINKNITIFGFFSGFIFSYYFKNYIKIVDKIILISLGSYILWNLILFVRLIFYKVCKYITKKMLERKSVHELRMICRREIDSDQGFSIYIKETLINLILDKRYSLESTIYQPLLSY